MLLKTAHVTLLVQCFDDRRIMRFPSDGASSPFFGLTKLLDLAQPISKQLQQYAASKIGEESLADKILPLITVEPILEQPNVSPSLLYLLRLEQESFVAPKTWPTLAEALKGMSQGRTRLAYNKAFQYFAGTADVKIDVLEADKQIQDRLKELLSEKPPTLLE